jgi:hypothetical protein
MLILTFLFIVLGVLLNSAILLAIGAVFGVVALVEIAGRR